MLKAERNNVGVYVSIACFIMNELFLVAEKFGLYLPQSLSRVIPKLAHIPYAETLAQELLQVSTLTLIKHHDYCGIL